MQDAEGAARKRPSLLHAVTGGFDSLQLDPSQQLLRLAAQQRDLDVTGASWRAVGHELRRAMRDLAPRKP